MRQHLPHVIVSSRKTAGHKRDSALSNLRALHALLRDELRPTVQVTNVLRSAAISAGSALVCNRKLRRRRRRREVLLVGQETEPPNCTHVQRRRWRLLTAAMIKWAPSLSPPLSRTAFCDSPCWLYHLVRVCSRGGFNIAKVYASGRRRH